MKLTHRWRPHCERGGVVAALKCRFGGTLSVRPESETGAKLQDGFLRDLR